MYKAQFELDDQTWSVQAGRIRAICPTLLPERWRVGLSQGRIGQFALRCRFDGPRIEATLLLPTLAGGLQISELDTLFDMEDVDWCEDADCFDAWSAQLGAHRCWINAAGFVKDGVPCPLDASFLPDWSAWQRMADLGSFTHQLNVVRAPASPDEQRVLRKHLARLEVMAHESAWPARVLALHRQLIERRLASPWLIEELLAADSPAQAAALASPLRQRLLEQAGPGGVDAIVADEAFDELLLTGLDAGCFTHGDAIANCSRSVGEPALFGRMDLRQQTAHADGRGAALIDCFVSHASADAARAARLCAQLEAAGTRCWIAPRDIAAGAHYAAAIDEALARSRAVVLLMSSAALDSPHVLREVGRAVSNRSVVLPVRLDEVQPQGAFAYLISACQWTDWRAGTDEQALVRRLTAGIMACASVAT